MGELGALFNPGMRHELEERQAKAARREEEGNAKDGDLRIDLESGVAVINAPDGQGATGTAAAPTPPAGDPRADDLGSAADVPASSEAGQAPPPQGATGRDSTDQAADQDLPGAPGRATERGRGDGSAEVGETATGPQKTRATSASAKPTDQPRPRGKRGVSAGR